MKPLLDPENWLSVKEAAYLLRVSRHTLMRLAEEYDPVSRKTYLELWKPSRGTTFISRQSLEQYCNLTRANPEFWSGRKHRRYRSRAARHRNTATATLVTRKTP